jgi:hypothetical protein
VIIGFGLEDRPDKRIYEYDDIRGEPHAVAAANINPYLVDAPTWCCPGAPGRSARCPKSALVTSPSTTAITCSPPKNAMPSSRRSRAVPEMVPALAGRG